MNELLELNNEYEITKKLKNTIGIGGNESSELIAIELLENTKNRIIVTIS